MLCLSISTLHYLFFDVAQIGCKIKYYQHIGSAMNIQVLKIPLNEFSANQQNGEVWYQGEFFDLDKTEIINDIVFVYAYHDKQEEKLVNIEVSCIANNSIVANSNNNSFSKYKVLHIDDNVILNNNVIKKPFFKYVSIHVNYFYLINHLPLVSLSIIWLVY